MASSSQARSNGAAADTNEEDVEETEHETEAECEEDDDDATTRKHISMSTDFYEDVVEPFVNDHFDGVFARAVRTCLRAEKERREENVDTVELKQIRHKVNELVDSINSIEEVVKAQNDNTEQLQLGVNETQRLTSASVEHGVGSDDANSPREIARIIRESDHALTMGGIARQTDLDLPELHRTVEFLMNEGLIEAVDGENGNYKYCLLDAEVGR